MEELIAILASLGLAQYAEAFRTADVDLGVLPLLTDADLKEIGLSLGHRRKLLAAIAHGRVQVGAFRRTTAHTPATAAAPAMHTGEEQWRQVTVMFCDLIGSTELMQRIQPEEMGRIIRQFQDGTAGAISRFEGFVDRFMGDAVLAFFGYPRAHEDAAERAVRAALAIIDLMGSFTTPTGEKLAARIAIASGPAFFGEIVEHGGAREPIVTGEVVNLAARLQAIAPANGIVIAPATRRLLRDLFELVDLGTHDFKGIGRPMRAWRVVRERQAGTRFEAAFAHSRSPIVGREAEIALLQDRWQSACSGEGQVVLLSGDAGMGKSRIAQALRDDVTDFPHVSIYYQCSPFYSNSALYPVIAQLQHAARIEFERSAGCQACQARDPGEPSRRHQQGCGAAACRSAVESRLAIAFRRSILPPEEQKQRQCHRRGRWSNCSTPLPPARRAAAQARFPPQLPPTMNGCCSDAIIQLQNHAVLMPATARPDICLDWATLSHVTTLALSGLPRRQTMALIEHIAGAKAPADRAGRADPVEDRRHSAVRRGAGQGDPRTRYLARGHRWLRADTSH